MFDAFVEWFASTAFYIEYVSQWPAPLNNVSFDAFLLLITLLYISWEIYQGFKSLRFHHHLKARQRREGMAHGNEDRRSPDGISTDKLLDEYLKFVIVAQMKNMKLLEGLSFEEFKEMKARAERSGTIEDNEGKRPDPAKADVPDVQDVVNISLNEPEITEIPEVKMEDEKSDETENSLTDGCDLVMTDSAEIKDVDSEEPDVLTDADDEWGDECSSDKKSKWSWDDEESADAADIQASMAEMMGNLEQDEAQMAISETNIGESADTDTEKRMQSDFNSVLNSREYRTMEIESMKAQEEVKRRQAEERMKELDQGIKNRIRVEGEETKKQDTERISSEMRDFEKRKAKALREEAKEAEKLEKKRKRRERKVEL